MKDDGDRDLDDDVTRAGPASERRPLGGDVIAGRYELRGVLGVGGMGAVYRVYDRHVREEVALKILQTNGHGDAALVERFRREVRLARKVTHRNAARIYDLGLDGDRWYLTMELIEGESVQALLGRERTLPLSRACALARDICEGLAAIHAAGVVHRDLKPGNVLIERGGRVVITDFGIAKELEPSADDPLKTRGLLGTPLYMAPEQAQVGARVDVQTDLYPLGVMLHRMITGAYPGLGVFGAPAPVANVALPEALARLIDRCVADEPARRPASARAVADALAAWATGEGDGAPTEADAAAERAPSTVESSHELRRVGARTLAVLPFRVRGRSDDGYLAEALAEELADVLSRTRGLWVISGGAAACFVDRRDPREIGRELKVDVVVDGTISRAGDALRIVARLLDVRDGGLLWNGRFDGAFADVFELQDRMARQLAEALRVELVTLAHGVEAPPEAIESYMRGRGMTRGMGAVQKDAVAMFERCLARASDFKPAIAALALALVRSWFFGRTGQTEEWERRALAAVERARVEAPELVETQVAIGVLELQVGAVADAARALKRALEIAPTCALAHLYLGMIEGEAGREERGLERLKLAYELDPLLHVALYERTRLTGLIGDRAGCLPLVARLREVASTAFLELRLAVWWQELDRARVVLDELLVTTAPEMQAARIYAKAVLAPADDERPIEDMRALRRTATNPRFRALSAQLVAELLAARGHPERALAEIEAGLDGILTDIVWLERCPNLESVRALPGYEAIHGRLRLRARAVWAS
ncbi:MAG: protein kinase [Myxococcales bacterium]|nr:protein kinase [Myxococcales bacterium]